MKKESWLSMIVGSTILVSIILGIPSVIINIYALIMSDGSAVVIPGYTFFSLSFVVTLIGVRVRSGIG